MFKSLFSLYHTHTLAYIHAYISYLYEYFVLKHFSRPLLYCNVQQQNTACICQAERHITKKSTISRNTLKIHSENSWAIKVTGLFCALSLFQTQKPASAHTHTHTDTTDLSTTYQSEISWDSFVLIETLRCRKKNKRFKYQAVIAWFHFQLRLCKKKESRKERKRFMKTA